MQQISIADYFSIISSIATTVSLIAILFVYRKDRQGAELARQAEVHAHATEQWREIVKLAIEHEELRPIVIRGAKVVGAEVVLFELFQVLMAYIRLIESRNESGVVGPSWVQGWKQLFVAFLAVPGFAEFLRAQAPVYDDAMNEWIEKILSTHAE